MSEESSAPGTQEQYQNLCLKGSHPLVTIFEVKAHPVVHTIRWCPVCGAVVGDVECKGVASLGGIFKFRKPKLLERGE